MSTAYRQTSQRHRMGETEDPENRLLWRMPVRRLEAEAVRDAVLTVSGKLNRKPYGMPVPVMSDADGQAVIGITNLTGSIVPGAVIPMHGEDFRRSVYVQMRRSQPLAVLETFDAPTMDPNCEFRTASTVAPQALMLMNSDFIVRYARYFAERVRAEAGDELQAQVRRAWRLAFVREPTDERVNEALAFLADQTAHFRAHPHQAPAEPGNKKKAKPKKPAPTPDPTAQALTSFCQALISSHAFLYVD